MGWNMERELETKTRCDNEFVNLQSQVDELKDLVNTLLSVICEEPDGVHSGAAPTIPGQPATNYCM